MSDESDHANEGRDKANKRKLTPHWGIGVGLLGIPAVALSVWLGWPFESPNHLVVWGVLAAAVLVLLGGLGKTSTGRWWGVLIDSTKRASLSKLQVTAWTVLILTAWFAIFLARAGDPALASSVKFTAEANALLAREVPAGVPGTPTEELSIPQIREILEPSEPLGSGTLYSGDLSNEDLRDIARLATRIEACRTSHISNEQGITDLAKLEVSDPGAATSAVQAASEACEPDPLSITFPDQVLLVLGISVASVGGSKLVKQGKANKKNQTLENDEIAAEALEKKAKADEKAAPPEEVRTPEAEELRNKADTSRDTANKAKENVETTKATSKGILATNASVDDAHIAEIFLGDDQGNRNIVDISKVQMFLFTIGLLLAYFALLANLMDDKVVLLNIFNVDLPSFTSSMTALLGISHAGYVGIKTADQTNTVAVPPPA